MASNKLCCQDSQFSSHTAIKVYIEKYKSDYVTPLVLSRSFSLLLRYNADIFLWPPRQGPLWIWFLFASLILFPTLLVFPTLCVPATLAISLFLKCTTAYFSFCIEFFYPWSFLGWLLSSGLSLYVTSSENPYRNTLSSIACTSTLGHYYIVE